MRTLYHQNSVFHPFTLFRFNIEFRLKRIDVCSNAKSDDRSMDRSSISLQRLLNIVTHLDSLPVTILLPLPPLKFLFSLDQRPYLDRSHGGGAIVRYVCAQG